MKRFQSNKIPLGKLGLITGLFTAAMSMALTACAGPDTKKTEKYVYSAGRPTYNVGDQSTEDVASVIWDAGEYGFVRIEGAEDARSANDHPVNLDPKEIRTLLGEIEVKRQGKKKPIPVFDDQDLDRLTERLATALAEAGPNQDVTFAIASQKGMVSLISPRAVTTGRMFYKNGRLNIIFGIVHGEFDSQLRATGILRPFTPGSREKRIETGWSIQPGDTMQYAEAGREDWIQSLTGSDTMASLTRQPDTTSLLPGSGSQQPVKPNVELYQQENPYYQDIENQLMGLLRLRRLDLITEEEYQKKRSQIINQL